ncbi:MAG: hypothetical protein JXA14_09285 [Anaerolineae bacterium]|nr:hypothetical protein [Anaerolineae bacterium]
MTGKQCIFCNPRAAIGTTEQEEAPRHQNETEPLSVFVVMPFRPNLDTFYEWSLKRYLREGLEIPDEQIRRADEFRDIGYVMCEKICRRIQEADLIAVDLSIENPNVMYEMGLAVGLHKPLLIFCNDSDKEHLSDSFKLSIGLAGENVEFKIIYYPSVGFLGQDSNNPVDAADRVRLMPRRAEMKIVPLLVADEGKTKTLGGYHDIGVTFSEALRGAVGVAMSEISETRARFPSLQEAVDILKPEGIRKLGKLTESDEVEIVDKEGNPQPFSDIAKSVNSAFVCIIDLAGENPHSYFWLGYCHARGINAIPIYRDLPTVDGKAQQGEGKPQDTHKDDAMGKKSNHVIAFDIRALWYIRFRTEQVKELALALRAALEELIAKDIPKQQRDIFWERLTRHPRIHIYTGAVHHAELNREVVGDWDQRTVSELVRYLSSGEESVIPELERPIYSPGTIKVKLKSDWDERTSLDSYVALVKAELEDKNCIIVASADVNPLTEVVLAHAYGVEDACFKDPREHEIPQAKRRKIVVALKGWKKEKKADDALGSQKDDSNTIPTFFSRPGQEEKLDAGKRGFLINDNSKPLQEPYKSQDEIRYDEEGFFLLSHLVVMQNPFRMENQDAIIVLLNGVSGPGTFGLAEVLTGGKTVKKSVASETLLEEINLKWANCEANKENRRFGVEGIIKVEIKPKERELQGSKPDEDQQGADLDQTVHDKFYDLREVVEWDFYKKPELMERNPRDFEM